MSIKIGRDLVLEIPLLQYYSISIYENYQGY